MAWSYSGNPGYSPKDALRFLIGDTDECEPLLQDGECVWLLSQYNNAPMNAAVRACDMVQAKFSRLANESVGRVSQDYSQKAKGYSQLRKDLTNRLATEDCLIFAGGISYSQINATDSNLDRVAPKFEESMMENRQIGPAVDQQNWGWYGVGFW